MGRLRRPALDSAAMSRVILPARNRVRPLFGLALSLGLLAGAFGGPASALDLPACSDDRPYDCVLPDWSEAVQRDIPSLFGEIEGIVWVDDAHGDAPDAGLDILGIGLGRVDVDDAKAVRKSDDLLKLGKVKKAVPAGSAWLIRVVLDRSADDVEGDHSSVHVATDLDRSRSNNAPSGVADPDNPFAGYGDIYSLTWASTTDKTRLLQSDLAKGWYKGKAPFAASWAAPNVLDVLIAPKRFGAGLSVITHAAGADGGYDRVSVGPTAIPVDGQLGLVPTCLEGSISGEPFVVRRLVENGQVLRDVEAPASWRGGMTLPVEPGVRDALETVIAAADEDGDGRAGIAANVNLFEDGVVIRQRPDLEIALEGDEAGLALELGLTHRGYNVLRDIQLESTGDAAVDAWLERASDTMREIMPPFRSTKKAGLVAGEGIGSCIPWLVPPEPVPDATAEPAADDAAASA